MKIKVALVVKNLPANAGDIQDEDSILGSGRSPGGGNGNPLWSFLPGKFHGQKSLAGYSPWGHRESDTRSMHTPTPNQIIKIKPYNTSKRLGVMQSTVSGTIIMITMHLPQLWPEPRTWTLNCMCLQICQYLLLSSIRILIYLFIVIGG